MGLIFFDPRSGALKEFRPSAPPRIGADLRPGGPREAALSAVLGPALAHLGFEVSAGDELRLGGEDPGAGRAWLRAAPLRALAPRGAAPEDFAFLCLRTHYRAALDASSGALEAARSERERLSSAARELAGVSLEPDPRALAGYGHRFRAALAKDLDFPAALDCVWDALRPGALSVGSRAALLRSALPALGLT